ncbi:glycoside hydrolase family 2 TIM barrel-domain containing protein [Hymenobacter koreensis]|uniref:Glycoside hydrolase family 2 TIM barrel-domain containing protein n=2 Tax=Hymenobacter koreensis TaxID=1084523 RepID=A0ABP8J8W9_9BACT
MASYQGHAQLLRAGKPYFIKGAAGLQYFQAIREAGGNSVRLWSTDYADTLLDAAHQQNLSVLLGIWLAREREGFDYYDEAAVQRQKEYVRQQVLRYRHHPALLMWGLGNELDMEATNPKVYAAVNDMARMIHELDPYHPVTTTLSGQLNMIRNISAWCPDVDVLSVNAFGSLKTLPADLKKKGWDRPYIVTEYGGKGYWESQTTSWNAPLEQNSTQKANFLRERYEQAVLADSSRCLGSYAFYWGQKFEFTDSWFSLFTPTGEKTAVVDMIQELWSGRKPANAAPLVTGLRVGGKRDSENLILRPGIRCSARIAASDPEHDPLQAHWEVRPDTELGLAFEVRSTRPEEVPGAVANASGLQADLVAPAKPGRYRISVTVTDGHGSAATANMPFMVQP